jgi:hypothetical protein
LLPVTHSRSGGFEIAPGNRLAFAADAVHRNDPVTLHKEPQDTRIQFTDVTQLE